MAIKLNKNVVYRAANVLFEAGVGSDIRRDQMHKCNLHTILRLPTVTGFNVAALLGV